VNVVERAGTRLMAGKIKVGNANGGAIGLVIALRDDRVFV